MLLLGFISNEFHIMAQTIKLIATLKRVLKVHGLSYQDVAKQLGLSHASVKRLFSEQRFSLTRLDKVCQMMEMEISDLVIQMNNDSHMLLSELSLEQEQEIAADNALLLVTVCILNHWTVEQLITHFKFSEHQCIRYLAILDRLKLIDLLPRNRIKLRVASNFKWLQNGPIQQFFQQKLAADFFNTQFTDKQEKLIVINGMLSEEARAVFQRKLVQLAREFDQLSHDDAGLPLEQRRGSTAVLAMRSWQYGLFDSLRK
jgi:DNA-binding Xre family transcriptional regulator